MDNGADSSINPDNVTEFADDELADADVDVVNAEDIAIVTDRRPRESNDYEEIDVNIPHQSIISDPPKNEKTIMKKKLKLCDDDPYIVKIFKNLISSNSNDQSENVMKKKK